MTDSPIKKHTKDELIAIVKELTRRLESIYDDRQYYLRKLAEYPNVDLTQFPTFALIKPKKKKAGNVAVAILREKGPMDRDDLVTAIVAAKGGKTDNPESREKAARTSISQMVNAGTLVEMRNGKIALP